MLLLYCAAQDTILNENVNLKINKHAATIYSIRSLCDLSIKVLKLRTSEVLTIFKLPPKCVNS